MKVLPESKLTEDEQHELALCGSVERAGVVFVAWRRNSKDGSLWLAAVEPDDQLDTSDWACRSDEGVSDEALIQAKVIQGTPRSDSWMMRAANSICERVVPSEVQG